MSTATNLADTAGAAPLPEAMGDGRPAVFGVPSPRFETAAAAYEALQREEVAARRRCEEAEVAARTAAAEWYAAVEAVTVARERFQRLSREPQRMEVCRAN